MDDDYSEEAEGAKEEIETVKALIMEQRYKEASKAIQMAMELYPTQDLLKEVGFGILIIAETLHYGDIYLTKCRDFDYYSVLHIPHFSTEAEVIKRCDQLRKELIHLKSIQFPGAAAADSNLFFAKANLCCECTRLSFDRNRNDCVFLDWPREWFCNKTTSSFSLRESYLNWKSPIYCVHATMDVGSWRKRQLDRLSALLRQDVKEKEEKKDPSLSPELKTLKRKVVKKLLSMNEYLELQ